MNKVYLRVGVVVLMAVAGLYFVLCQPTAEPVSMEPVDTATSSVATTATTTEEGESNDIELDLSKLQGKDRLYTEEEGKYENLSEEERKMIQQFKCRWYREKSKSLANIYCVDKIINSSISLISLKSAVAVIYEPGGVDYTEGFVYVYDITSNTFTEDRDRGNYVFNKDTIVKADYMWTGYQDDFDNLNHADGSKLQRYHPGMKDFVEVSNSKLSPGSSYLKWEADISRSFPVEFYGDEMMVSLYSYDCSGSLISEYSGFPVTCTNILKGTRTFDLSNLY